MADDQPFVVDDSTPPVVTIPAPLCVDVAAFGGLTRRADGTYRAGTWPDVVFVLPPF